MSLCTRILSAKRINHVSPQVVQLISVRGAVNRIDTRVNLLDREPNPTDHSYYKQHSHGRSPVSAKSLAQILAARQPKLNPRIHYLVDIGLPPPEVKKHSIITRDRTQLLLKNRLDPELEKQARHKTLEISLEEVEKVWMTSSLSEEYCNTAKHFGIFQDLYEDAFFYPRVPLYVTFKQDDTDPVRVFRGNIIKPSQVTNPPSVTFSADPDSLWSLLLTNPDGHLTDENSEYIHWFIGNIPGNDVSKGDVIWDYLQPFPPHGTGYQRLVFVLYKQEERLDYSSLQKKSPCLDLNQRTFKTYDFYRERQDVLTPAGLCFYQSTWDQSVKSFFHYTLQMKEPRFLYDFPKDYRRKQDWFPTKEAFDLYLDKYKDPKDINKRYLIKKLKDVHPFEKPPAPLKYPLAQKIREYKPSWLLQQMRRDNMGCGRIRNV